MICDLAAGLEGRGHRVDILDIGADNAELHYRRHAELLNDTDAVLVYGFSTRAGIQRSQNEEVIEWVRERSGVPVLEFVYSWTVRTQGFPGVTSVLFSRHEYESAPVQLRAEERVVYLPHALRSDILGMAQGRPDQNLLGYVGTPQEALWMEPVNRRAGESMGLPDPAVVAQAIKQDMPEARWRFCGPEYGKGALVERLGDFVEFAGYVPFAEIGDQYRQFGAYLYTNAIDSFGLTILEAQWCGTPVLCFDTPHYREIAGDGALFCRTPADFVDGLAGLRNVDERRRLSEAGRANAARFTVEAVAALCEKRLFRLVNDRANFPKWKSLLSGLRLPGRRR